MVFDGALDSDQVDAIKQLLRDKVPIVRARTVESDSVKAEQALTDHNPDTVVYRDADDAVALDMNSKSEVARYNAVSGRGAYRTIQDAHDALPSDGGHIHIVSGYYSADSFSTFNGNAPLLHVRKDNVTITGDGPSTVLTIEDGATASNEGCRVIHVGGQGNTGGTTTNLANNFHISHLKIDGNQQNNGGDGDGNTIDNLIDGHNLQIQGEDFVVTDLWSINSCGDGVEPISRATASDGEAQTRRGVISNNVFVDNWEQNIHPHGCAYSTVTGNVCRGEVNNANINLFSETTDNIGLVITGNVVTESQQEGAILHAGVSDGSQSSKYILFAQNYVADNSLDGVVVDERRTETVIIKDNIIHNNGGRGILGKGATNVLIEDNTIVQNADDGIEVNNNNSDITGLFIHSNWVKNNNTGDNGTAGGIDIFVQDGTTELRRVSIQDNAVIDTGIGNHNAGIRTREQTAASAYDEIRIEGNWLFGSSNQPIKNEIGAFQMSNRGANDFVGSPPSVITPYAGMEYLDDGSNTGSGTKGKRIYSGGGWNDAWTL